MSSRRGLRTQILASLFVAVVLAFGLLDLVIVRLGEHALGRERERSAHDAAALLLSISASGDDAETSARNLERAAKALLEEGRVVGVEIRAEGSTLKLGRLDARGRLVTHASENGEVLLRLASVDTRSGRRQREFLFLYVALTGIAILGLAYVVLTILVVRPIEMLRLASERLAGGRLDRAVEPSGPAELRELATSFNRMAEDLRRDREALERRLEELEATTHGLREAQEQLVLTEKLASVGRLSAGVAHEIGNPLAAILGLVELLESGDLSREEESEFVRRIRAETERIHVILRDLLDFARQGADASEEANALTDAREVALEAATLLRPQRAFRNIELVVHEDEAFLVRCPEARLRQVFLNLLLNAADAMEGEGSIDIRFERGEGVGIIHVDDDGPGIAPEVMETLFEPFVTTKEVGKGTGLGLAVCHTIVSRSGGKIVASGHEGRGARFTLTFETEARSTDV